MPPRENALYKLALVYTGDITRLQSKRLAPRSKAWLVSALCLSFTQFYLDDFGLLKLPYTHTADVIFNAGPADYFTDHWVLPSEVQASAMSAKLYAKSGYPEPLGIRPTPPAKLRDFVKNVGHTPALLTFQAEVAAGLDLMRRTRPSWPASPHWRSRP